MLIMFARHLLHLLLNPVDVSRQQHAVRCFVLRAAAALWLLRGRGKLMLIAFISNSAP